MTYLLAMTYNFPAVSFQWVLHSAAAREQKNFRHYMLPVGYRYSRCRMFYTILLFLLIVTTVVKIKEMECSL